MLFLETIWCCLPTLAWSKYLMQCILGVVNHRWRVTYTHVCRQQFHSSNRFIFWYFGIWVVWKLSKHGQDTKLIVEYSLPGTDCAHKISMQIHMYACDIHNIVTQSHRITGNIGTAHPVAERKNSNDMRQLHIINSITKQVSHWSVKKYPRINVLRFLGRILFAPSKRAVVDQEIKISDGPLMPYKDTMCCLIIYLPLRISFSVACIIGISISIIHTQKFLINSWVQSKLTQDAKFQSFLIEWTDNWLNTNTKDAQISIKIFNQFLPCKSWVKFWLK